MNWSDLVVIAIIAVFGFIGIKNGFIYSIFKLVSFFVAAIASVKLYPVVAGIIAKTAIFTNIKASILANLTKSGIIKEGAQTAVGTVVENLKLPGFLKDVISGQLAKENVAGLLDFAAIADKISGILAHLVIDLMSLVLLYIAIRIALFFARHILQGIAELPLFKQMDKLGGFAFGAIEGLLTLYIIFAVLMLFSSVPAFKGVFEAVETSVVAKFFYANNFIVDWMFPAGKVI